MVRPTEKEIWSFLDDRASMEVSKKVVKWLSSKEGRLWLSANSSGIFSHMEETGLSCDSDIPSDIMLDRIHSEIDRRSRRRRWSMAVLKVAAAIIPLIALGLIWAELDSRLGGSVFSAPETVSEAAQPGERKVLIFQDGTKVYLNAGAVITFPRTWRLDRRRVSLEGEAYFEVAHNRKRPFTVDVFNTKVKVYGTSFNVNAYPEDSTISVALIGGSVAFEADGREHLMKPSQLLTYNRSDGSVSLVEVSHPDNYTLWTANVINFRDNTLENVMEVLGRWYDVSFDVADRSLLSRRFTFRTTQLPLRSLLDEMEYISDLKFELENDRVTVSKK